MRVKFENTRDNAPDFDPCFDFDHNVDYAREVFMQSFVNVLTTEDNKAFLDINNIGLRYKHCKKVSIKIVEGQATIKQQIYKDTDCLNMMVRLQSPTGKAVVSDSFSSYEVSWVLDAEAVFVETSDGSSIRINFETGVEALNVDKYMLFLLEMMENAPEEIKKTTWKKILDLKRKFNVKL